MEENIKILEEIIKGNEDCIESISKFNSNNKEYDEDIEHYKREIRSITNAINYYKKEKARADKLEKEYSKMLTKIDEYEVNYIPVSLVEENILKPMVEEHDRIIKNILEKDLPNRLEDGGIAQDLGYFIEKIEELLEKRK